MFLIPKLWQHCGRQSQDRNLSYDSFEVEMKVFHEAMFGLRIKFMEMKEFWNRIGDIYGVKLPPFEG